MVIFFFSQPTCPTTEHPTLAPPSVLQMSFPICTAPVLLMYSHSPHFFLKIFFWPPPRPTVKKSVFRRSPLLLTYFYHLQLNVIRFSPFSYLSFLFSPPSTPGRPVRFYWGDWLLTFPSCRREICFGIFLSLLHSPFLSAKFHCKCVIRLPQYEVPSLFF